MTYAPFRQVRASLADLLGRDYVEAVARAGAALGAGAAGERLALARRRVDFLPAGFRARQRALLARLGRRVCPPFAGGASGATSAAFAQASRAAAAPLAAAGLFRVGEDGRLRLILKSEHYHASLGHAFPGFALLDCARRLGIPNATHNNTRGHIARRLEERLVAAARAGRRGAGLDAVLSLQTGSLAVEAGLKMMLARFYRIQEGSPRPPLAGRTPVFLVIGDRDGDASANYHGTPVSAQILRGMWKDLAAGLDRHGLLAFRPIRPNDGGDLDAAFAESRAAGRRPAGFLHELVLMNYGGLRLEADFVRRAYALCRRRGVPTLVDEIQTGLWYPELFAFREYGVEPDFVALGKGFSGGESAASRLLFSRAYDALPQFGALVTNGQEEIASLAYLVAMHWAKANAEATRAVGDYYEERLRGVADRFPRLVAAAQGRRHLGCLVFHELETARAFCRRLGDEGFDISVQTYKDRVPPAALTKLPLIAGREVVDVVCNRMEASLAALGA